MKMIFEKIQSNVVIEEDTHLHGMIVGPTMVSSDITFNLHGMIIGNLTLKNNSNVYIFGIVNGNIVNKGGRLEVFGIINGKIIKESGITNIHDKAIINENWLKKMTEEVPLTCYYTTFITFKKNTIC